VDRNDRLGPFGNRRLDQVEVHAEGVAAVDEDRSGAQFADRADGGDEGVGGRDDLVARPQPKSLQRNLDGVGSRSHADGMPDADQFGEQGFELGHGAAQGEVAGGKEAAQFVQDLGRIAELFGQIGVTDLPAVLGTI
jgi:hypothetical protein